MWIQPVSQVQPRQVDWLWPGRLALGKLALLEGDPDLGKSFLALDLCARLSTNRPMPDGSPAPGPANSLYLFVEDGGDDTIRPRLARLGADMERIFIPKLQGDESAWALPRDLPKLRAVLAECRPRLVVFDPVLAFLDAKVQCYNEQSLRRLLTPLARLAEETHCAFLLLRHLNKAVAMRALYRGVASIAFTAACRSVWLAARLPGGEGRCVLAQQKNNLAARQPSLAYEVAAGPGSEPELRWHGEVDWSAARVLEHRRPRPAGRRDEATAFLRSFLADTPKTSRQVWAAAAKLGLTESTLRRAAAKIPLTYHNVWLDDDRLTYWLLPGQTPPPADPATDLEPWLAPLRERYPAASPLDE
jgi:putative DNA primase/helicase